jgi:hypothetical protein
VILTVMPVDPTQAQYAIALMARYGVKYPGDSVGQAQARP